MSERPTELEITTQLARRTSLTPPASWAWTIVVLEGESRGKTFRIDDVVTGRTLLGTSPSCAVQLVDRTVSRRHAAVESDDGGTRIIDLGSRNGTFLGGARIRDAYLAPGQTVRLGETVLRFDSDGVPRAVPASTEVAFGRVVGMSAEMRALYPLFAKVAATDVSVLIEGETGTGKEVVAESLHDASPRARGPFVVLDCTTVSPALLEAELFGHERGAFTGAIASRAGLFEEAHGGTLFIDEIGDLDLPLQAKLLRALERKEVRRVGSNQWVRLDVRVLAATRRDLDKEIAARRFRDDLYYRLAVSRVELPALRKRMGDVAFLTKFFWRKLGGDESALDPSVLQRFEAHDWPGNVRELANAVAQQLALGEFSPLRGVGAEPGAPAPDFIEAVARSGEALPRARQMVIEELERRYVQYMLEKHDGNVTRAAAASGIGRRYFQMVRAKR